MEILLRFLCCLIWTIVDKWPVFLVLSIRTFSSLACHTWMPHGYKSTILSALFVCGSSRFGCSCAVAPVRQSLYRTIFLSSRASKLLRFVPKVRMHGFSNQDTQLYPLHNNSSYLTTKTEVRCSGRITDGTWSSWTTLRDSVLSSPTSTTTLLEWPCQEEPGPA